MAKLVPSASLAFHLPEFPGVGASDPGPYAPRGIRVVTFRPEGGRTMVGRNELNWRIFLAGESVWEVGNCSLQKGMQGKGRYF